MTTTLIAKIKREQAGDWAHGLMTQPSSKLKDAPMTKRSAGNAVSHAAQLFAFLAQRGKWEGPNPVKSMVVMTKKDKARRKAEGFQWEAFDTQALKTIFAPANFVRIGTEHTRWPAVIGLYTGGRVSEIAQLYLADSSKKTAFSASVFPPNPMGSRSRRRRRVASLPSTRDWSSWAC